MNWSSWEIQNISLFIFLQLQNLLLAGSWSCSSCTTVTLYGFSFLSFVQFLKPSSSVQDVRDFEELCSSLALILSDLPSVDTVHIDYDFYSLMILPFHNFCTIWVISQYRNVSDDIYTAICSIHYFQRPCPHRYYTWTPIVSSVRHFGVGNYMSEWMTSCCTGQQQQQYKKLKEYCTCYIWMGWPKTQMFTAALCRKLTLFVSGIFGVCR